MMMSEISSFCVPNKFFNSNVGKVCILSRRKKSTDGKLIMELYLSLSKEKYEIDRFGLAEHRSIRFVVSIHSESSVASFVFRIICFIPISYEQSA